MNSGVQLVVGILGVILTINLMVWIPLVILLRRKANRVAAKFRAELESKNEAIVFGPEPVRYSGATEVFPKVSGTGVLTLTQQRVVFHPAMGRGFEFPVENIRAVREQKAFMGRVQGGRTHVVVKVKGGAELGFAARDHAGWVAALTAASKAT